MSVDEPSMELGSNLDRSPALRPIGDATPDLRSLEGRGYVSRVQAWRKAFTFTSVRAASRPLTFVGERNTAETGPSDRCARIMTAHPM
jgi:hypothetical protein